MTEARCPGCLSVIPAGQKHSCTQVDDLIVATEELLENTHRATMDEISKRRQREARAFAKHPGRSWRVSCEPGTGRERSHIEDIGDFDELVVDHWIHLEKMDRRKWWMRLGEREFDISIGRDGKVEVRERED